jgi:glutamyl/glutaminyl-tRNA synthetase
MPLVKYTTRFNPTVNGPLHVGHIYVALVNEAEAHSTGGKFIVRFEDNQPEWVWKTPDTPDVLDGMIDDLNWLGIQVDEWVKQSDIEEQAGKALEMLNGGEFRPRKNFTFLNLLSEVAHSDAHYFAYAPYLTAEKAVMDVLLAEVNLVIRGEDLLSEDCLYAYFCEKFGLPRPRMVYIPRLRQVGGNELLSDISKSNGGFSVASYRESGVKPKELLHRLRVGCLIDPEGSWVLRNVKRRPEWVG